MQNVSNTSTAAVAATPALDAAPIDTVKPAAPVAVAAPATAKPAAAKAKPIAKPVAAAKPAKPADTSKADAVTAREKLIGELRTIVAKLYDGPSLAVRTNARNLPIAHYAELLKAPKHRTTLARVSVRDESALALIAKRLDKAGTFCPSAINLDAGIFSRLCSVAFIAKSGERFTLTQSGLAHAKSALKRAA